MDDPMIATLLKNLDLRLARVEQVLPTLATKEDLRTLATKEDVREEGERSRRHMTMLIEHQAGKIQLLAEQLSAVMSRLSHP